MVTALYFHGVIHLGNYGVNVDNQSRKSQIYIKAVKIEQKKREDNNNSNKHGPN